MSNERDVIGDRRYQEKAVQALLQDIDHAEQMHDVMSHEFFDQEYLSEIVKCYFDFKNQYNTWPSLDVLEMSVKKQSEDDMISERVSTFLRTTARAPLNGDASFIKDTSLEFCRKQNISKALLNAVDMLANQNYDAVVKLVMDAVSKGSTKDLGHDYCTGFQQRVEKNKRKPMLTPWPVLNGILNGGWEKKSLVTFIAPTGAGKTHFLCNVSAGAVAMGQNVCYITLEIADYKIGLRHDAYFSGIKINEIQNEQERAQKEVEQAVTGRLFIKEFATKRAGVQTIRSYLQRLESQKNFKPDLLVLDYADLLRSSRSYDKKHHELEGSYEELRGLAQEFDLALVTADQTNRTGLDQDIVTIGAIAECYAKATVCDLIMTISRKMEDRAANQGRIFIAKNRFGPDGMVLPFIMNSSTVKATLLEPQSPDADDIPIQKGLPIGEQLRRAAARYDSGNKETRQ